MYADFDYVAEQAAAEAHAIRHAAWKATEADFRTGLQAGQADIGHKLPVRRFDGCSKAYIEGYAMGYTMPARQAMEQLYAMGVNMMGGNASGSIGDFRSEDDMADARIAQRSYAKHIAQCEQEILASAGK
jgi:hypothetical protein